MDARTSSVTDVARCPQRGAKNRLKAAAGDGVPASGRCGTSRPRFQIATDAGFDAQRKARLRPHLAGA